ncbi:MAG TPA: hypothetical protein VKE74_14330 [Gemmataceae bacterium]|nr:hypothetical protein [Gemmataceae bacterium]
MDATPGDDTAGLAPVHAPRSTELLLDALKAAIGTPGEHRLFRSGKLAGLFPNRVGLSAEAALFAIRAGLLETVRTETRGKVVFEWVKATPKAVAFVHENDSPKSVLKELKQVLDASRTGVPAWMDAAKQELAAVSAKFEEQAAAMLKRLEELAASVEAALRRAEAKAPAVAEPVGKVVPWAVEALEYLDRRATSGAGDCPLPELFHAVRVRFPELTLPAFHDGLRRLHDVRAVRLTPAAEMTEPEYAILADGKLMYAAGR